MSKRGLEPPLSFENQPLMLARLPFRHFDVVLRALYPDRTGDLILTMNVLYLLS